jgi:hypothetical protein
MALEPHESVTKGLNFGIEVLRCNDDALLNDAATR